MTTWAFRIDTAIEDLVHDSIWNAPRYDTKVPTPMRRAIGLIHGLGNLHEHWSLHELEVYLGRAGDSAQSVLSRWKTHRRDRGHKYGAVLFRCSPERAVQLEGVAIRALKQLKARNKLCVGQANIASSGQGGYRRDADFSTIYMTWVGGKETEYEKPNIADIREIAQAIARPDKGLETHKIENGLMALRRLSYTERLRWRQE